MRNTNKSNTAPENKDLWSTPLEIVSFFNERSNKSIVLDAAASNINAVVDNYIDEEMNTLKTAWGSRYDSRKGSVWLNPPFSDITPFVDAAIINALNGCEATVLVTNSTCAKWYTKAEALATNIYLPEGRIGFISAETGKPVGRNDRGSAIFHFDPKKLGRRNYVRCSVAEMMKTPVDPAFLKRKRFGI